MIAVIQVIVIIIAVDLLLGSHALLLKLFNHLRPYASQHPAETLAHSGYSLLGISEGHLTPREEVSLLSIEIDNVFVT
jgi:hypothetical protein